MILLSVIVPIYNTESYLPQCIESIMRQTYSDIEIILVNDGSIDTSGEICDRYSRVDKRIRVIHEKKRGGLLNARLRGVQHAHGDYIGFVDSDDWIADDMYETLMFAANADDHDVVSMSYTKCEEDQQTKVDDTSLFGVYKGNEDLDKIRCRMMFDIETGERGVHPSLCTKVIKRQIVLNELIKVDKKIKMGEDAAVFYPCCLQINSIKILREYKYFYRMHEKSMCHSVNIDIFKEINIFDQYMRAVLTRYDEKYELLDQLKEYVWVFLKQGLDRAFSIRVGVYPFPYFFVKQDSDIILYGAGKVGRSYYLQIRENAYCNIIAWLDKKKDITDPLIDTPDKIRELKYTKVVIAVKKKEMAEEIMKELIGLGVERDKIIWAITPCLSADIL